jgi:hypothetical protein
MLLKRADKPAIKRPEPNTPVDDVNDPEEIVIEQPEDKMEYKSGLTDVEKADVDAVMANVDTPTKYKIIEKESGMLAGIDEPTRQLLNEVTNRSLGDVVLTSGFRTLAQNAAAGSGGNPNSFHLKGQAMDLRPNPTLDAYLTSEEGRKYIASMGYEIVDERNREGYAPHWHLEPAPTKFLKGGLLYKRTK